MCLCQILLRNDYVPLYSHELGFVSSHAPTSVTGYLLAFLFAFTLFTCFLYFLFTVSCCGGKGEASETKNRVHGQDGRDKQTEAGDGKVLIE